MAGYKRDVRIFQVLLEHQHEGYLLFLTGYSLTISTRLPSSSSVISTIGPYWPLATALRMRSVCSSDKPGSSELAQPTTDIGTFRFTTRLPPSVTSMRMCRGDPWTPAGDDGGIG